MCELELLPLFYCFQISYNRNPYLETPEMVSHRVTVNFITNT